MKSIYLGVIVFNSVRELVSKWAEEIKWKRNEKDYLLVLTTVAGHIGLPLALNFLLV